MDSSSERLPPSSSSTIVCSRSMATSKLSEAVSGASLAAAFLSRAILPSRADLLHARVGLPARELDREQLPHRQRRGGPHEGTVRTPYEAIAAVEDQPRRERPQPVGQRQRAR